MKLIFPFLLLLLFSCKTPCKKLSTLLEKHPECAPKDTLFKEIEITIPGYQTEVTSELKTDSAALDSLQALLSNCGSAADSILSILQLLIPKVVTIDPVDTTTKHYHLKISIQNGKLSFSNTVFPDTVKTIIPQVIQNLIPQGLESDRIKIKEQKSTIRVLSILLFLALLGFLFLILKLIK